jgi:hypothetical protein
MVLSAVEKLYSEDLLLIKGQLPPESRRLLIDTDRMADSIVTSTLAANGLGSSAPKVPYAVDPMEPTDKSITNGYTNGATIGINPYIIPQNNLFNRYMKKLSEAKSPFARYVYGKLQKPVYNLLKTIVHEKMHIATQMRERRRSDGSRTNFLNDLYEAATEYFEERLPKGLKPLSRYLAGKVFVPMAEGLNEGMTYEAMGFKNTREIKASASKEPTSYAASTVTAADSVEGTGETSFGNFYKKYFRDGYRKAKEITNIFLGKYFGSHQMQTAFA